jgi:hypothetical protein
MYSLIVTASEGAWDEPAHVLPLGRFLEYTDEALKREFGSLSEAVVTKIPTVFAYEFDVGPSARVGWIKKVQTRDNQLRITPAFDESIPPISREKLNELSWDLEIGSYERSRTHWAIKKVDLLAVLSEHGIAGVPKRKAKFTGVDQAPPYAHGNRGVIAPVSTRKSIKPKVFLVHGHDGAVKNEVARFLEKLDLEVVILHERPNLGRTLISKFSEESADVVYAVVLITPDDVGRALSATRLMARARQNVVFELGFFLGRLGSERVCAVVSSDVEKPSDFEAVVYVRYGPDSDWRRQLARELAATGIPFDHSMVF